MYRRRILKKVFSVEKDIACAMHFAAFKSVGESVQFPAMYYSNNLNSLIALVNVMKSFGVQDLIFSSSCTVYGEPDHIPVGEDAADEKSRVALRCYEADVGKNFGRRLSIGPSRGIASLLQPIGAHPSAALGELPMGVPNNLVPYITQTAIGKRPKLTVFGDDYNTPDGSCLRDFIHVVDLAQAHIKAMEYLSKKDKTATYNVFNLGTGVGVSVLELVNKFQKVTGVKLNYSIGPRRSGDVEKTYADPTKAFKELNWKPKFSIEDGLLHACSGKKSSLKIRKDNGDQDG
ncbi:MAG: GDP-mannose 4,6-dehydratase [Bacteroidota bacterium]